MKCSGESNEFLVLKAVDDKPCQAGKDGRVKTLNSMFLRPAMIMIGPIDQFLIRPLSLKGQEALSWRGDGLNSG